MGIGHFRATRLTLTSTILHRSVPSRINDNSTPSVEYPRHIQPPSSVFNSSSVVGTGVGPPVCPHAASGSNPRRLDRIRMGSERTHYTSWTVWWCRWWSQVVGRNVAGQKFFNSPAPGAILKPWLLFIERACSCRIRHGPTESVLVAPSRILMDDLYQVWGPLLHSVIWSEQRPGLRIDHPVVEPTKNQRDSVPFETPRLSNLEHLRMLDRRNLPCVLSQVPIQVPTERIREVIAVEAGRVRIPIRIFLSQLLPDPPHIARATQPQLPCLRRSFNVFLDLFDVGGQVCGREWRGSGYWYPYGRRSTDEQILAYEPTGRCG